MAARKRDYKKRYEAIMRNAEQRKFLLNRNALNREVAVRNLAAELRRSNAQCRSAPNAVSLAYINAEIDEVALKVAAEKDQENRILLKAELAHLSGLKLRMIAPKHRKPPEAGIAVPALPPKGPLPKQGGAEAPLEFD